LPLLAGFLVNLIAMSARKNGGLEKAISGAKIQQVFNEGQEINWNGGPIAQRQIGFQEVQAESTRFAGEGSRVQIPLGPPYLGICFLLS
jgi:hypothetical protein